MVLLAVFCCRIVGVKGRASGAAIDKGNFTGVGSVRGMCGSAGCYRLWRLRCWCWEQEELLQQEWTKIGAR